MSIKEKMKYTFKKCILTSIIKGSNKSTPLLIYEVPKKEAEKKAAANEQVVKTATATTGEDKKSDTVKTGDPAQAGMLATTMLGGFAGIAASLKMKFRKKED